MTSQQTILGELHSIREQLLAESGGTLAGLVARLQKEQNASERIILKSDRTLTRTKVVEPLLPTSHDASIAESR